MARRFRGCICAAILALVPGFAPSLAGGQTIEILAAASTTEAVTELSDELFREHGVTMRPTFAASSTLAKQIAAGAPAHLFLSADLAWLKYLEDRGLIAPRGRVELLGNRLVLLRRIDDAGAAALAGLADLGRALGQERLIMGDPAHVPAGRYGRQALRHLGLWAGLRRRAAFGASVRDALGLLARGQGRFAIAYATDIRLHGNLKLAAAFPEDSHAAIIYPLALIRARDGVQARKVFRYLTSARAGKFFARYGFTFLPKRR